MRHLFHTLCVLLALGVVLGVGGTARADKPVAPDAVAGAELVDAARVVELAQSRSDLVIVDARRGEEFAKGHIEGAVNLLDADMTEARLRAVQPDAAGPIVFYCNGPRCLRSSNAAAKAVSWGYTQVYWFRGGWSAWVEARYPMSF
ncbi:MAG: rhodanese-like domain-containing protein [Alphaproteobacteria bacterium]|nr:rhodanese-like domain-containing protein [Alphaproteobacteria bacterium]MBF0250608.1 rhodanese-like domain-containing protein [Alphaproteobacteria bacterium]